MLASVQAALLGQMVDAIGCVPGLNTKALCQSLVKDVRLKYCGIFVI